MLNMCVNKKVPMKHILTKLSPLQIHVYDKIRLFITGRLLHCSSNLLKLMIQ